MGKRPGRKFKTKATKELKTVKASIYFNHIDKFCDQHKNQITRQSKTNQNQEQININKSALKWILRLAQHGVEFDCCNNYHLQMFRDFYRQYRKLKSGKFQISVALECPVKKKYYKYYQTWYNHCKIGKNPCHQCHIILKQKVRQAREKFFRNLPSQYQQELSSSNQQNSHINSPIQNPPQQHQNSSQNLSFLSPLQYDNFENK